MKFTGFVLLFTLLAFGGFSQKNLAKLTGIITDENGAPLAGVTIQQLNAAVRTLSNDSGKFSILLPTQQAIALEFSHTGFITEKRTFYLNRHENETLSIFLRKSVNELVEVTVSADQKRREANSIAINPNVVRQAPNPLANIEGLIKIFVGSNNELTSQYSVRGGSYDENLVYVNDFEIFRPYLVRSGQQEGLSFINPDLTQNVKFYNGGFQAKYGDKMSSVLDISYRNPTKSGGSVYISLLEQGAHLEGISRNKKFSYLIGARNRSNRNLLSSQDTKGNYVPSSSDIQALLSYRITTKWKAEIFGNFSSTKFTLYPEESKLTSGVFSPMYSSNLGLDIFFEGQEKDNYNSNFQGLSLYQDVNSKLKLKYMFSHFGNNENENIDITGAYIFGERDNDQTKSSFGSIINPLGAGVFQNYARNKLNIDIYHFSWKGSLEHNRYYWQWGLSAEKQFITDRQHEWEYNDSAGYALPHYSPNLSMFRSVKGSTALEVARFSGYVQNNIRFHNRADFILQPGIRFNYNDLNGELLISPRIGFSFKPKAQSDLILKGAVGRYVQPPFYREMRRYDGSVNTQLLAQKSIQASFGADYNFKMWKRPARITSELYYKDISDAVAFDIDNVRIRYFGENNAKAWAAGLETRLYAELVKDAESWISVSFMKTQEDLLNDYYVNYYNAAGEIITPKTPDKQVAYTDTASVGWLRRPTDRFISFGMFFQDYLSTNKNFKVYLSLLFGSNLPYNVPDNPRYRNALTIDAYLRADIGFSMLLLDPQKANRRSHSPFKNFESIWASFEVFNLIDKANTISYMFIKDFSNSVYTMPNRLTPRLINFKIAFKW